jgi:type II pantothenate kinase
MSILIGLDIGGSTTKIVGFDGEKLLEPVWVKANDQVASAYGAFGKFTEKHHLQLKQIRKIMATGVGLSYLEGNIFGIETQGVPEFDSFGIGGLYLSGLEKAIVVSMGTGTSIVAAQAVKVQHLIGSGVGGGTLIGLLGRLINVHDFETIEKLSQEGDLNKVDLSVGDITTLEIPGLTPDTTASNFGKVNDLVEDKDLALGVVNLVFQSVGTAAVLCARLMGLHDVVVTGNLTCLLAGRKVLQGFSDLYGLNIVVPKLAEYATAVGAALIGLKQAG